MGILTKGAWEDFDKDGLLLQKGSYTAKRSGHIETEQYVSLLPDGKKEEASRIIKYDKTGNVISERYESEDFSFYRRYEYLKFDNKNNWTERLVYLSDTAEIPNNIQIREIEYF